MKTFFLCVMLLTQSLLAEFLTDERFSEIASKAQSGELPAAFDIYPHSKASETHVSYEYSEKNTFKNRIKTTYKTVDGVYLVGYHLDEEFGLSIMTIMLYEKDHKRFKVFTKFPDRPIYMIIGELMAENKIKWLGGTPDGHSVEGIETIDKIKKESRIIEKYYTPEGEFSYSGEVFTKYE